MIIIEHSLNREKPGWLQEEPNNKITHARSKLTPVFPTEAEKMALRRNAVQLWQIIIRFYCPIRRSDAFVH